MQIINLKDRPCLISDAIESEIKNHNTSFINDSENVLNYCLFDEIIIGEVDYQVAFDVADILFIYIKNDYRRNGFAYKLLSETLSKLKNQGIKEIFLEVRKDNTPAINLYKKMNFKEIGVRKAYYDDNMDAILMRKEL